MTESARQIREGNPRMLARTATGIENRDPQALATLHDLAPFAGRAKIVGITGPPGAGKSTLVDALATVLRREGKTLAILAVDPTSGISGGAILGDRIRMQQHHADPGIFIRSMATRGSLGGLARATADLVQLMDASGKDYVVVETVGVGQAEIAIASLAQVTVVVLVPGMGDDIQAIKAGILEIADVFAINKADQPGADKVEQELQAMLSLANGRKPPIVKTVATTGEGIADLLEAIQVGRTPRSAPAPQVRPLPSQGARQRVWGPAPPAIPIHVNNLHDVVASFQSAGAQIQSNADGHILIEPPPGVILELIEEAAK